MKELQTNDFTVTQSGDAFISQPRLASLINIAEGTITSYISRSSEIINTINGLDSNSLEIAVAYFAMDSRASTKEAKDLYRLLAKAGAKAYIYNQAGYVMNASIPAPVVQTRLELAKEQVALIEEIERKALEIVQLEHQVSVVTEIAQEATTEINTNREWASVKFVEAKYHIKIDWRIVKKWNTHLGKDTKYIEDQNYVKVRTYHKEAWLSAYNVEI